MNPRIPIVIFSIAIGLLTLAQTANAESPKNFDYNKHVAPIFQKYCNGCHSSEDREGGLVLDDFAKLLKGGKRGTVIVAKNSDKSRLIQVLEKKAKPFMPPKDNEGPTAAEIAILKAWIKLGARGPSGKGPDPNLLVTPKVPVAGHVREPINALAVSPDGKLIAVARYGVVEILSASDRRVVKSLGGHNGHVNDVAFSHDGTILITAAGEVGLFGELRIWSTKDWTLTKSLRGHRDSIYTIAVSPDGRIVATGSYDRAIKLWSLANGKEQKTLSGHNDAVFDIAFHPGGKILASASGDRTVKLWDVATGSRLDTLNQPIKEQYAVAFSPNGEFVLAAGVDNRIRMWRIEQMGKEGTNRIVYSRFAHEGPIISLAFAPNGKTLVSSAENQTVKLWDASTLTLLRTFKEQPDWPAALSVGADSKSVYVGRLDGSLANYPIDVTAKTGDKIAPITGDPIPKPHGPNRKQNLAKTNEAEPNDDLAKANQLVVPAIALGVLQKAESGDVDLYRFDSKAGQAWIIETKSARDKSPADTKVEVLHANGKPVLRLLLRAVRDSYITFRPIDSRQTEARLKNWEEMKLNQFLYMDGEVVKNFRMPKGPDSGMLFYTIGGKRRCYFDTSATVHALNDTVYIVEPYRPVTKLADNGLPVFPLYFANDDSGNRKLGADSRLTFTAPADGKYLVRVTDVRGFGGDDYKYSLTVREPKPGFNVSVTGKDMKINAGSGKRLKFNADRIDGFSGDIKIEISGMPPGFHVASPVVIEAGHIEARSVVNVDADTKAPSKEAWAKVKVVASAVIHGKTVAKELGNLGELKIEPKPKLTPYLLLDNGVAGLLSESDGPIELVIEPGTTITAMLRIERNEFNGESRFDIDNLPHGVIVDNLGLSGIMVREGETERQIYLTASDWTPESTRWIHAVSQNEGNQSSRPILLRVKSLRNAVTSK